MPIRMSGINSGLDTDSIVSALVTSYSTKKQKYEKAQTKLEWTQDAWKGLNKKVYSLYTNVSNLRFSSAYSLKKTTVSDNTKATVKASNTAAIGTQTLSIKQVAQSGYMTGGQLKTKATSSTKLSQLGMTSADAEIGVKVGDTTTSVKLSSSDSISDVVNKLKDAGVNASFDEANNRFFVNSRSTGKEADFTLTYENADGLNALKKLGLYTQATSGTAAYDTYKAYAALAGADDTATANNINSMISEYNAASASKKAAQTELNNLNLAAGTYADAYSGVQDFNAKLSASSFSADNKAVFDSIMSMSATERANSLVDGSGNIYTKTGKDQDGNEVFANGSNYILKKATSYSYTAKDADGNEVTKNYTKVTKDDKTYYVEEGKEDTEENRLDASKEGALKANYTYYETSKEGPTYVDSEGKEAAATKDAEGNITAYTVGSGSDAVTYTYDEASKTYKDADGKAMTFSEKYTYPQGAETSVTVGTEKYDGYIADLKDAGIKEEEVTAYGANLNKVKAMEAAVAAETPEEAAATNSMTSLAAQIKEAYNNGYDGKTGKDAVDTLATSHYNQMSGLQTTIDTAEKTMADDSVVKEIAGKTGDELTSAIEDMVSKVNIAVSELANAGKVDNSYNAAIKVDGKDAIITLNGAEYTNSGNTFSINGLSITAQAATVTKDSAGNEIDNPITITTNTDTQGIYDKIKDFLTSYNNIINEMNKLYNAASSKGYEPLTDEEKDEMSDSEIEKWEQKIKDSLFRHDNKLNEVMSAMTTAMSKAIEVNGKKYSLSSFGVHTLGFLNAAENEGYAYHIDGDEDDENTAGKTDKLMAAITSDPDTVVSFFQGVAANLYEAVGDKMKSSSVSSAYTIYNDKQMDKQQKEYKKLIAEWEDRISKKEDYYYSKFSAMESALAKLNSTQSSIGSFFGQ